MTSGTTETGPVINGLHPGGWETPYANFMEICRVPIPVKSTATLGKDGRKMARTWLAYAGSRTVSVIEVT